MTSSRSLLAPLLSMGLCSLAASGCGDDDPGAIPRGEDWVVQSLVETPAGRTAYVHLMDAPGVAGSTLDTRRAREIAGNGRVYILNGKVYLGDPEARTVVRGRPGAVTVEDDSERLSFDGTQLSYLPSFAVATGPNEAYFLNGEADIAIAWDPVEMVRGETIDLSPLRKEGLTPTIEHGLVRDGKLYFMVQQINLFQRTAFMGVQVGVIDLETRALTVIEDERCVGSRSPLALAEDGSIYVEADNYNAVQYILEDAPSTCVLRILPGASEFDPDYELSIPSLTGGREASGFVYAGAGIAYVAVTYEEEIERTLAQDPFGFFNQPAARFWRIDLEAEAASEVPGLPFHSIAGGLGFVVEGRVFLVLPTNRLEGETYVYEVDPSDAEAEAVLRFETRGLVPTLGRISGD